MATREYYDGADVFLFIKRTGDSVFRTVACLDSNSFSFDRELKEITNKCVGKNRDGIAGKATWGLEASGQAISDADEDTEANYQELLEISVAGEKVQAKMANASGSIYRAGEIIITSYKEDANSEDPFSFTTSFAGLGVPVIVKPV